MGLLWESVWLENKVPLALTARLVGDKSAMPKSVPILWRFMQDWHCLQVGSVGNGEFSDGYHLYFTIFTQKDNPGHGSVMHYRRLLRARFVMVREGRDPVCFFITDRSGTQVGELIKTDVMVPANRFRRDITPQNRSLAQLEAIGPVAWV